MNLMQKYLSQAMLTEYKKFIRWLGSHDLTAEEIKENNPELLKDIHETIEEMDKCFNMEDYQGFRKGMEKTKALYSEAIQKTVADVGGNDI